MFYNDNSDQNGLVLQKTGSFAEYKFKMHEVTCIVKKLNMEGHPVRYLISDLLAQAFN